VLVIIIFLTISIAFYFVANCDLPVTENGQRPYITGGLMKDRYDAIGFHFHWGDFGMKGSEHTIDGKRYPLEMHIVHLNERYASLEEAVQYPDGLAVLGVMFKKAEVFFQKKKTLTFCKSF